MPTLTAERLRELLHYDPLTGVFIRKVDARSGRGYARVMAKAGQTVGMRDAYGYLTIKIGGKTYKSHRLAWLYVYGEWPAHQIDHINNVFDDNRIVNLRVATLAQNRQNLVQAPSSNLSCGLLGVSRNGENWQARIGLNGVRSYLGTFETPELAFAVYLSAKAKMHPFQTLMD